MIDGFESKEAFAHFNFLIDFVRGNLPKKTTWDKITEEERSWYMDEAEVAEYVITEDDVQELESWLVKGLNDVN